MSDSEEYASAKRYKRDETTSDLETSPILIDSDPDNSILDTKIFNDPIHGSIELHWLLVKLIDTPEFQRLRRLRQLGLAYYVYPGACHQRFEHSIGTCYLAGELLTHLCHKQPELNITPKDILCVQMAALCHDLGHGPFSHTFEDVIAILRPELHWKHEHASVQMFDHLIERNRLLPFFQQVGLKDIDITFVKELIHSEINGQDNTQVWPYKGRDISKSFLYEIVSNRLTGIDVDKFDYFARDSYYLGTKISFEHMRFIKFYRVIKVDDGKRHLCLRDKEVKACYEIYRIRDDLHRRAYQHPVAKGIELMLREALIAANDYLFFCNAAGRCDTRLAHIIDDMYTFSQADDHLVTLIKHSYHPNMDKAKEILEKIERREIYRYIGNTQIKFTADFQKKECQNACHDIIKYCHFDESQSHITENDLVIQTVDLTCGDRGKDPIQNMWFYTKITPNKATKISKEQVSAFLPQTFREQDLRLYCKMRDPTVCSIVRCAFKEFCIAKGYAVPKGSDLWMAISPISEQRLTPFAGIATQVMSKSNKNQKSITSFFKTPAQATTNEPAAPKPKPTPPTHIPEIKKNLESQDYHLHHHHHRNLQPNRLFRPKSQQ
ncbi:unnamed protein product [Rotaria socialis]|uniref:HD/PDEase domain-containing protein n=1 Tax=Rotaria socialis TaxID=392032 RepID=A0A820WQ63_9BILA|nr:unnamed protein product [Rotaria socialis]